MCGLRSCMSNPHPQWIPEVHPSQTFSLSLSLFFSPEEKRYLKANNMEVSIFFEYPVSIPPVAISSGTQCSTSLFAFAEATTDLWSFWVLQQRSYFLTSSNTRRNARSSLRPISNRGPWVRGVAFILNLLEKSFYGHFLGEKWKHIPTISLLHFGIHLWQYV